MYEELTCDVLFSIHTDIMSQDHKLLQAFLSTLHEGWLDRIKRATYSNVVLQLDPNGILVKASWENRDHTRGEWSKLYEKEFFFGNTLRLSWEAHEILIRPCDFRRAVVHDLLNQRGVG